MWSSFYAKLAYNFGIKGNTYEAGDQYLNL